MGMDRQKLERLLPYLQNGERTVVELISRRKPIDEIAERVGLPEAHIKKIIRKARFAFGANDDLVDDYLRLLENWSGQSGENLLAEFALGSASEDLLIRKDPKQKKQKVISDIESNWTPDEMRGLAASLMRLADAIDQDWSPERVRAVYSWPSSAARFERNSLELAKKATLLLRQAKMREKYLPKELLGEPAWNILLDLCIQFAGGAKVSSTSLCIAADCPQSTALRYLAKLEGEGLIEREDSPMDGRVTLYGLTKQGVIAMGRLLESMSV